MNKKKFLAQHCDPSDSHQKVAMFSCYWHQSADSSLLLSYSEVFHTKLYFLYFSRGE